MGLSLALFWLPGPLPATAAPTVFYRVNAGGPAISGSPGWGADPQATPSSFSNAAATGNTTYATSSPIDISDPSLPAGTPAALFQAERWDGPAAPEMQWNFPVTAGTYQVNLYFAEIYAGAMAPGARVFNVSINGSSALTNFDVYAIAGANRGIMRSFVVASGPTLTIDFTHVTENPAIKGIEITSPTAQPNKLGASPSPISFNATTVGQKTSQQVTLTNLGGSGDPSITVSSASIAGTDASQFTDSFTGSATLAPGASTSFSVTFAPTSSGSKVATLSIAHSGTNTPLSIPLSGNGTVGSVPVGFGKSALAGGTLPNPTSLQFGPDGRLYVGTFGGLIKAYTVARNGTNSYSVTATETISAINSTPNHDDNGAVNSLVTNRLITGILVAGTATNPVIYVAHSDPRIGGGSAGTNTNLDTNSSMISRLTWNGTAWQKFDVVRGLPRSQENHAVNGLQLDPATNILYVGQGGNTNMGAPSNNFALLPEYALSAAILSIDLTKIGSTTYDIPTLDNPSSGHDPFGGLQGKNQAIIVPGGPVQVYASGFRNPYDLVITSKGRMYAVDNGSNAGWGGIPQNAGPQGNCTNAVVEPGISELDGLHFVSGPGTYAGHPNPTRGNTANTFGSPGKSPVPAGDPVQCDYRGPASNGSLTTFATSTDGITEYTASNFGGAMTGDLLMTSFDNSVYRVKLDSTGTVATLNQRLFSNFGQYPLDVTTQGDQGQFPGVIWVADYGTGQIFAFEPNDFGGKSGGTCTGAYSLTLDEDHDGYSNADEIDNGTDPCSAASVPPDHNKNFLSDLNDPNDDSDGLPDSVDPFQWDPYNGMTTHLPVKFTWKNGSPSPGGFLNLGFQGLMSDGKTDYLKMFDPTAVTAGGAAGVFTVDGVPPGDAYGSTNTQKYGLQFGLNANPATTGVFTAHTRIKGPFAGLTPAGFESMGLYIGTGTQDNYLKIVTSANSGSPGIEVLKEVGGSPTSNPIVPLAMPGPQAVDLYLTVNPAAATVQPSYRVTDSGGTVGSIVPIGSPLSVPSTWFTVGAQPDIPAAASPLGLAIGIISTSSGGSPFPATWDGIDATPGPAGTDPTVAADTFSRTATAGWGTADAGGPWTIGPGTAANFSTDGTIASVAAPAGGAQQVATLGSTSARDVDARATFTLPGVPTGTGSGYFGYLLLRKQSAGSYYRVGLFTTPSGVLQMRGQTDSGASLFTDLDTTCTATPGICAASAAPGQIHVPAGGGSYILRVQASGASPTTIQAKVWPAGSAEPLAWNVTATDSTAAPQQAGSIGVRILNSSGAAATIKVDDLQAVSLAGASSANLLGASVASIAFPSTAVGQTASQPVTLTNLGSTGDPSITVNPATIGGTDASQFSNNSTAVTLGPGAKSTFTVTFSPISGGSKTASLSVAHTGSNTPLVIPLSGTATQQLAGSWQTLAPSSVNRQEVSYAFLNGKFYLAGSKQSQLNEAYNPATNSWSSLGQFPASIDHIQSVALNGKIYYLGGLVTWPTTPTNTVYIYDPATNTFTQGATMPRPRGAGGVAVFNGKIYYAGGLSNGTAVPWFDVYDPVANSWSQLPDMPHARDHFQAQLVNGKFWAIGGRVAAIDAMVGYNEAYDFASGTWQTGFAPLPTLRGGFATAVLGTEILVIGGEGGGQTFSTNEAYNTATNTWRTLTPMPTARHGIEAAVCNGGVYITAGGTLQGAGAPTNVQQVFFLNGPTTCTAPPPPPPPPPGTTIAQDSFTRTVTGGWGSAQTGGAWSIIGGSAANFSVDGSSGVVVTPASSAEQLASLAATSIQDVNASVKITFGGTPSALGGYFGYLTLRRQSSGAYYRVGLMVTSSGMLQIRGQTSAGTALFPDAGTGLTVAAGQTFQLRVQAQGANPTTIRARAWRAGTAEPSTWTVTATSSSAGLQQAGSVGIRSINTTTGSAVTLKYDDLIVVAM